MNSFLLRNIKNTLLLLSLAALFQNCSRLEDLNKESRSSISSQQVTGVKCPIYLKPSCGDDSQMRLVENERGCSYHICERNRKLTLCPEQSTPLCKNHEEIKVSKDQNSCSYSECTLKKPKDKILRNEHSSSLNITKEQTLENTCPSLDNLLSCGSGKIKTLAINSKSCLTFKCRAPKNFSCPVSSNKVCRKNETTFSVFDQKGCANIICKNTAKVKCPNTLNISCKRDELLNIVLDDKGCKKSLCVKKPRVASQGCNLEKPPRCFSGKKLHVAVLPNGCTKPFCY